jgi:hypothetical protein
VRKSVGSTFRLVRDLEIPVVLIDDLNRISTEKCFEAPKGILVKLSRVCTLGVVVDVDRAGPGEEHLETGGESSKVLYE